MAQVNLNIDELKGFVNHIIKNNRFLQEQGKNPVAVEVVGESGIGKWVLCWAGIMLSGVMVSGVMASGAMLNSEMKVGVTVGGWSGEWML